MQIGNGKWQISGLRRDYKCFADLFLLSIQYYLLSLILRSLWHLNIGDIQAGLVRYILLYKMRYISLRSMRYDINPYYSRAEGTYRTIGISRTRYISQIRQDLYRGAKAPLPLTICCLSPHKLEGVYVFTVVNYFKMKVADVCFFKGDIS